LLKQEISAQYKRIKCSMNKLEKARIEQQSLCIHYFFNYPDRKMVKF
jgi:hypothetical protein